MTMKKFRFLDWEVYDDGQKLFSFILKLVARMPKEYRYDLGSQLLRSTLSVILNTAEGSGKDSDKELNRFFEIALGPLHETLAGTDTLRRSGFVAENDFVRVEKKIASTYSRLGGFKKKIGKL
jgi:four helix bundle protein